MSPFRKLGVWYVALHPIVAGMSMFEFRFGELNYTGFLWFGMLVLGLMLLALIWLTSRENLLEGTWWPWFLWGGFVWSTLAWTSEWHSRNIQDAMQMTMPIVVGVIAACTVRTRSEMKLVLHAFVVTLGLLTVYTVAYLREGPIEVPEEESAYAHVRGAALAATLVGSVMLASLPGRKLWPLLGWGLAVAVTALTGSRMAAFALLVAMVIHPLLGSYRRAAAIAAILIAALTLFYTPAFQERFFPSGSGDLGDLASGQMETSGRVDAWSEIWRAATEQPLLGAGVGTSHELVERVWGYTEHVHNDYLRVFCEMGAVGLAIFVTVCGWQLIWLAGQIRTADGVLQQALVASFLGLGTMLVTCLTDNTITYNLLFTDPLFAVIGSTLGLFAEERRMALSLLPDDASRRAELRQKPKLNPSRDPPPFGRGIILPNQ